MPNSKGSLQGARDKLTNHPRDRGMSPPQRAVERFETGEKVHLRLDPSVSDGRFNPRFNGHTGEVIGEQGRAFEVRIVDGGTEKTLITTAAHLTRQPRTSE
jgi:large subunit ribosomal protein L21e